MRMGISAASAGPRLRFVLTWVVALAALGIGVPKVVNVSWHGVVPVLASLHLIQIVGLTLVWALGLWVRAFALTAAAPPSLTHRRALTLSMTGSAISNVVPLGGAAGVAVNLRMMSAWGIGGRSFICYTFLTNVWDILVKLTLPAIALIALYGAGASVTGLLQLSAAVSVGIFMVIFAFSAVVLLSPRLTQFLGGAAERGLNALFAAMRLRRRVAVTEHLLAIREECAALASRGWWRMSLAMLAYVASQGVLLWWCLRLSGAHVGVLDVLAGFAVERFLTVLPLTPGGLGVADLGLAGVLLALGGNPTGVTAGVVLYRVFIFALQIPAGGGTFGLWLLGRRRAARRATIRLRDEAKAHVTDVFLPRLGAVETNVEDLARR